MHYRFSDRLCDLADEDERNLSSKFDRSNDRSYQRLQYSHLLIRDRRDARTKRNQRPFFENDAEILSSSSTHSSRHCFSDHEIVPAPSFSDPDLRDRIRNASGYNECDACFTLRSRSGIRKQNGVRIDLLFSLHFAIMALYLVKKAKDQP